uniref:Odorant binding protein 7 n=1 Tax=Grapholita molesta TaxID=192188 RepID=A0A2R4SBC1_GRAMO|nr:odorant binding protein 7 [Grapholita molesta]
MPRTTKGVVRCRAYTPPTSKADMADAIKAIYLLADKAMTEDQKNIIKQHFHEIGMKCIKDNPITAEDISMLKDKKLATGPNVPCFLACMLKEVGVMDNNGMLSKESALELAKKVFNDAEELKAIENYLHSCSHVNTESVSDGDKGCERAMLSHKCMLENAAQFGFDL